MNLKHCIPAAFSILLFGCMSPAEEFAFDQAVCSFDSGTFTELKPGDGAYELCMELQFSGIGPDDDPDFNSVVTYEFFD